MSEGKTEEERRGRSGLYFWEFQEGERQKENANKSDDNDFQGWKRKGGKVVGEWKLKWREGEKTHLTTQEVIHDVPPFL